MNHGVDARPIILVSPDVTVRQTLGVDRRVYELNAAYCDAVEEAGGLPLVAPYTESPAQVAALLKHAHGLLLTGGDFDVDPRWYNARPHPKLGTLKPDRSAFEKALLQGALASGMPVLGVCGGMQLLNVVLGGSLVQHLPEERAAGLEHSQKFDRRRAAHAVALTPGCRLAALFGQVALQVNTSHHQAVDGVAPGLVACGLSPDGVVEALEQPGGAFVVGVQWHPETLTPTPEDPRPRAVYQGLVDAARVRLAGGV